MKYIIFEDRTKMEYPILFGEHMSHKDIMLNGFTHPLPLTQPVAAGYCNINSVLKGSVDSPHTELDVYCYGESVGMKLKSRGEVDAKIIERMLEI